MPELPEVETIRRDLEKKIINQKIVDVFVSSKAKVFPIKNIFIKKLKNNQIKRIDRIGKLLILVLEKDEYLLIHLKMTGQLIYQCGEKIIGGGHSEKEIPQTLPDKSTRIFLDFLGGGRLYFNDQRRFGYMKIVDKNILEKEKNKYGIEPLQNNFTLVNFQKALQNRKTSIKAVLLNQKIIAGVGNIYADESCFAAGIKPSRKANTLSSFEIKKLYQALEKVIAKSIQERGTTFNHYRDSEGKKGNFVSFLKVYGRGGQECKKCHKKLKKAKVVGRGTVFCENCQK